MVIGITFLCNRRPTSLRGRSRRDP